MPLKVCRDYLEYQPMSRSSNYFRKHTSSCGAGCDFTSDEKRLQNEFDNRTLLRWNHQVQKAQVWYNAPSGLYCVMSIDAPYSISKVIWLLKRRQQKSKEALKMYTDHLARRKKEDNEQIAGVAAHTADAVQSWSVGKLTTSGKQLCR